jgi:general secretion pathway protein F
MPRFSYTAYDSSGRRSSGTIDSDSREAAIDSLFRQGRYPLELTEGAGAAAPRWWERELFGSGSLRQHGVALLTRELATLVKADIPMDEALRIAGLQPLMPARVRRVVGSILARVLAGASLSEAIDAEGGAFPPYYSRIVHAGEAAGTLGQALDDLAQHLERSAEFRSRIGSALLYPALLLVAAAAALAVIVGVLIPTIAPLFADAGVEPPFVVRTLLALQQGIAEHWPAVLIGVLIAAAAGLALSRSSGWRLARDRLALRLPLISRVVQNSQTAVMSRTLGTLIRSGVPLVQALQITGNAISNRAMAGELRRTAEDVKEGTTLTSALAKSRVFPELALRLTGVGEQTGQLDVMLERVGTIYEAALQRQLLRITGLITPVMTIVIGVLVGGLLLSVMGAIFSVNELAFK